MSFRKDSSDDFNSNQESDTNAEEKKTESADMSALSDREKLTELLNTFLNICTTNTWTDKSTYEWLSGDSKWRVIELLKSLIKEPFGNSTPFFLSLLNQALNQPEADVSLYVGQYSIKTPILFWLMIEQYVIANQEKNVTDQQKIFPLLKEEIEKIKEASTNAAGTKILPSFIDSTFIRHIYLSQSPELIHLFFTRLPIPPLTVFQEGDVLPDCLIEHYTKHNRLTQKIKKQDNEKPLSYVLKLQRNFRQCKRQKEEYARIIQNYFQKMMDEKKLDRQEVDIVAKTILDNANKPYVPQCDQYVAGLSSRILEAAKKTKKFDKAHHITSKKSLSQIFDSALFGQGVLLQHYTLFSPAALGGGDLIAGDGKAICFGLQDGHVDPRAYRNDPIIIQFNFDKLCEMNPHIFYKQMDFGYIKDFKDDRDNMRIWDITLGQSKLSCDFTKQDNHVVFMLSDNDGNKDESKGYESDSSNYAETRGYESDSGDHAETRGYESDSGDHAEMSTYENGSGDHAEMKSYENDSDDDESKGYESDLDDNIDYNYFSCVMEPLLIGYDLEKIHEILALNFFRFIDELKNHSGEYATEIIQKIYSQIARLSNDEMVTFLENLRTKMTAIAEFNFYGAHQIDFSSIVSITFPNYSNPEDNFILNLPEFIELLKKGQLESLLETAAKTPELFQSARFITYLLKNIPHTELTHLVCDELHRFKSKCQPPVTLPDQTPHPEPGYNRVMRDKK